MLTEGLYIALGLCAFFVLYTYGGYPVVLWVLAQWRGKPLHEGRQPEDWPSISVSVPAYNEEAQIGQMLKGLLALDYPRDRVQIIVVSDASSDGTDDIVRGFSHSGVHLLRLEERGGKTRAENAVAEFLTGDIVVNTDASVRISPHALKPLIAVFDDPEIGCASGRDVSVGSAGDDDVSGESGYVGYEMAIRDLETRVGGIVGASGCFYAIRPHLHRLPLPGSLSRDFAAALHTREHGYRAVSVPRAVCYVPRSQSLRREYRRKVRTMTRGMQTLWHKRALLNPLRYGVFAWMLLSHKVCRWALPWVALTALVLLTVLAQSAKWAGSALVLALVVLGIGAIGWAGSDNRGWKLVRIPAYLLATNVGAAHALIRAVTGRRDALWEPTRRPVIDSS